MSDLVNGVVEVATLGLVDDVTGADAAADASRHASNVATDYQNRALNYTMEREELPNQYRDAALMGLGQEYGLSFDDQGNPIQNNTSLVDRATSSPLYSAILGTRQAGQDAIEARAAKMGMSRSGNVEDDLYSYNANLKNRALLESYNQQVQGLGSFANLPTNTNQIASQMAGIGQTQAQGITGSAQAYQDATGMLVSGAAQGLGAYFSDSMLKDDIRPLGKRNGHNWYQWTWNDVAASLGLSGASEGVIADEVKEYMPEAVGESSGYMTVNYKMLGVA